LSANAGGTTSIEDGQAVLGLPATMVIVFTVMGLFNGF
jgi:hypothetical protein